LIFFANTLYQLVGIETICTDLSLHHRRVDRGDYSNLPLKGDSTMHSNQAKEFEMDQVINADPHSKIALQGYDPVAFHQVSRVLKGNPAISAEYLGYKYLFSSELNKVMFEEQMERYLPAYGGYCAYGVSIDVLFPIEINTWEIIDGRLVLQFSQEVKHKFGENTNENMRKANENWSQLKEGTITNVE
jgi:YHS domain-containing protein